MDKQYEAALDASYQLSPGDTWPAEGSPSPTSSSSAGSSGSGSSSSSHPLSGGAIAGIVVGIIVFFALGGALIFYVARSQTYQKVVRSSVLMSDKGDGSTVTGGRSSQHPFEPREKVTDPRFSGSTAATWQAPSSPPLQNGHFVGYNRHTGAPEFATEAPVEEEVLEMPLPSAGAYPDHFQVPIELEARPSGDLPYKSPDQK